jgi:hypothetical protein
MKRTTLLERFHPLDAANNVVGEIPSCRSSEQRCSSDSVLPIERTVLFMGFQPVDAANNVVQADFSVYPLEQRCSLNSRLQID